MHSCSYYTFEHYEKQNADPSKINDYIYNSTEFIKDLLCTIQNDIILINLFENIKKFSKLTKYVDIKSLINDNVNISTTRGGTRMVYLLDNVVIKEGDPTCYICCEQITNYFTQTFKINIVKLIGIIFYNYTHMIVEIKYTPIYWFDCINNIDIYKKYLIKFNELVTNINLNTVLGDYNLGNILLDKLTDKLIITDFNGMTPVEFMKKKIITNVENANNFNIRLINYLTDNRIKEGITNQLTKSYLTKKIEEFNKELKNDELKLKYLKYKQKYLNLKNN